MQEHTPQGAETDSEKIAQKKPKPRDPGQKIRKSERKWLLRVFAGRDAQGSGTIAQKHF